MSEFRAGAHWLCFLRAFTSVPNLVPCIRFVGCMHRWFRCRSAGSAGGWSGLCFGLFRWTGCEGIRAASRVVLVWQQMASVSPPMTGRRRLEAPLLLRGALQRPGQRALQNASSSTGWIELCASEPSVVRWAGTVVVCGVKACTLGISRHRSGTQWAAS